jgi:multidrug efflux pump subunit AcrA (membrane-fusion protein)
MKNLSQALSKSLLTVTLVIVAIAITFIWFFAKQVQQTKIDVSTIVKELREVSRLETAVYTTEQIVDAQRTDDSVWRDFLFGDRILLIAHGTIVAGIDLENLSEDDIKVEDGQVILTLPPAEIFSATLDEDKTRVYDRTTGLLNPGDINLESEARQQAAAQLQTAACDAHILENATMNAQAQLESLLTALSFEKVTVIPTPTNCLQ